MDSLVKADVFFFVTTIAVVVLTLASTAVSAYLVLILRDLRAVSRRVRVEAEEVVRDFSEVREEVRAEIREEGVLPYFMGFLSQALSARRRKPRSGKEGRRT